jgi:HAD superfamily hydrolase (TIGR01549 family)
MAIIFDLDGTLANSVRYHAKLLRIAIKEKFGINVPFSLMVRIARYPYSAMLDKINQTLQTNLTMEDFKQIHEIKLQLMQKYPPNFRMFFGANNLLIALKELKVRTAIATSLSSQELMLYSYLNLPDYVDVIVHTEMTREKPDPYVLFEGLRALGSRPDRSVYIGDSVVDYYAAQNAGMDFIGMYNKELPDPKFFSYSKLSNYLLEHLEKYKD